MGNLFARGLGRALLGATAAAVIAMSLGACDDKKEDQAAQTPAPQESTQQPAAQDSSAAQPAQPAETQTASAAAPAAKAPAGEVVLNRGFGSSPDTLDPHVNFGAREGWIQDDMYEGFVSYDTKGGFLPGAAEKWEVSDDGLTWTFHLREGLKWSNGDPLVAQDYVNGVIRQLEPKTASPRNYYFYSTMQIAGAAEFAEKDGNDPKTVGISAPDDRTVVIKLINPFPNMLYLMGSYYVPPLHKPSFEKFGTDFIKPENIVNNGAYKMAEMVPQSHVTLVKNEHYWDAANVKIDKVVYVVTEDDQTELKRYKADELDTTNEVPSNQLEPLKSELGGQLRITTYVEAQHLSFNITKPPFDNVKVRQAIALGIDRQVLQDKILKAGYKANCGYSPPNDPRYPQPQIPECSGTQAERSEKGKALLAEAGYGPGKPLKVVIDTTTDNTFKKQAEGIALMLKQNLGVEAKVNAQEFQAWMDSFYAGNWELLNDNLIGDMPGPESHLSYMRPSSESGYFWKNDEYEKLMDEAATKADINERYKLEAAAEKILLDFYLLTPLNVTTSRHLVKPWVKGWDDNMLDVHPTKLMSIEK